MAQKGIHEWDTFIPVVGSHASRLVRSMNADAVTWAVRLHIPAMSHESRLILIQVCSDSFSVFGGPPWVWKRSDHNLWLMREGCGFTRSRVLNAVSEFIQLGIARPITEDSTFIEFAQYGYNYYFPRDKSERLPISDESKNAVICAGQAVCSECGSGQSVSIDHRFPWSLGGSDDIENLSLLCRGCNSSKGAKIPAEFFKADR